MEEQPSPPIHSLHHPERKKKLVLLLGLLVLTILVIPLTVLLSQEQQDTRQRASFTSHAPAGLPSAAPTVPPLKKEEVQDALMQGDTKLNEYLQSYNEEMVEYNQVNTSLDDQIL